MPRAKNTKNATAVDKNSEEQATVNVAERVKTSRAKKVQKVEETLTNGNGLPKGRAGKKVIFENDSESTAAEEPQKKAVKKSKEMAKATTTKNKGSTENGDTAEKPKPKRGRGKETTNKLDAVTVEKPKNGPSKRPKKGDADVDAEEENLAVDEPKNVSNKRPKKGAAVVTEEENLVPTTSAAAKGRKRKEANVEPSKEVAKNVAVEKETSKRGKKRNAEEGINEVIATKKEKSTAIKKKTAKTSDKQAENDAVEVTEDTDSAEKPAKKSAAAKKKTTKRTTDNVEVKEEEAPETNEKPAKKGTTKAVRKKIATAEDQELESVEAEVEEAQETAEKLAKKKKSATAKKKTAKTTEQITENIEVKAEEAPGVSEKPKTAITTTEDQELESAEVKIEEAPDTSEKKTNKATARKRGAPKASDDAVDELSEAKPSKAKKALLNPTKTTYNKADFELADADKNLSNVSNSGVERKILKISSWNVAGLRSWLKKDGLKFLEYEDPDIFCMQEIKATVDQMPDEAKRIPGYHPYWLCLPGGYAGVALYSKIMPINVEYGIGNAEFDEAGRLITAEYEKFFLLNVYVPNSGRKLVNLEARMRWEKLFQAFIQKLDARKPVIICGDMNVSHTEIDLANPKSNLRSAGFTIEEREKMTELLSLGFLDTFRELYPEKIGAYTYWTYMANARARNVGWRLDYFIVSERIGKRVTENAIRSQVMGSDHCPITLFINI